jgi:hypothetical protein
MDFKVIIFQENYHYKWHQKLIQISELYNRFIWVQFHRVTKPLHRSAENYWSWIHVSSKKRPGSIRNAKRSACLSNLSIWAFLQMIIINHINISKRRVLEMYRRSYRTRKRTKTKRVGIDPKDTECVGNSVHCRKLFIWKLYTSFQLHIKVCTQKVSGLSR